jgi:hypothetical protein
VQWQRGHHYLTLVYQIEEGCKRLLYVGLERTAASLRGFLDPGWSASNGSLAKRCP